VPPPGPASGKRKEDDGLDVLSGYGSDGGLDGRVGSGVEELTLEVELGRGGEGGEGGRRRVEGWIGRWERKSVAV
jgi:hypothetical protein